MEFVYDIMIGLELDFVLSYVTLSCGEIILGFN